MIIVAPANDAWDRFGRREFFIVIHLTTTSTWFKQVSLNQSCRTIAPRLLGYSKYA
jgi:hypothetical protein